MSTSNAPILTCHLCQRELDSQQALFLHKLPIFFKQCKCGPLTNSDFEITLFIGTAIHLGVN